MTPLVWYLIDDSQPYKIPIEVLRRNAHWIRILERHHRFLDLNSILVDDDACGQPCSPLSKEQRPQSANTREVRSPSTSTYMTQSPPSRISTAPRWRLPWRRSQQRPPETTTHQGQQRPNLYNSKKEPPAKQTTFSKSEVAQPRITIKTSSGMVLLKQLTFSAWIPGVDKVLRMNPNLEQLTWQGASLNKDVPVGIWDALLGDIPLSSSLLSEVPSPFQKLRDIHFKRCNLDATLLLPVLEKLPGLRILRFTDVVLLNMNSVRPSNTSTDLAVGGVSTNNPQRRRMIPSYRLHQIRQIRLGIGLQKSGSLEAIVRYCPYLMRLVLESDFDAWSGGGVLFHHHLQSLDLEMLTHWLSPPAAAALAPKQDTFLVFVQHLKQSCPRLRAIEYVAPRARLEGVPLLSDEQACIFAQCLETGGAMALPKQFMIGSYQPLLGDAAETRAEPRGIQSEQESIRAADEQDEKDLAIFLAINSGGRVKIEDLPSYFKVEFKADLCRLDHLTAWALCQASMTLQSVSLFLSHGIINGEEENIRHSLRNAFQILTTCQGLRSFKLEFDYQNSTSQPIALATYCHDIPNPQHLTPAAWILFDAPWNCPGLETLVLSGIKRSIYLDREKSLRTLSTLFTNIAPEVNYSFLSK
ncbi:hypothetical protein EMPS_07436 [Entomortierella parvispora]|uniref:Uncharacterized protein n=1 Tax=Entomortierella parvispora TaxID=205924 RepID=A0A9P3HEX8_9FUNG|nr:hypothetical protein EMPS_07436 [Entomortierella parvispora]